MTERRPGDAWDIPGVAMPQAPVGEPAAGPTASTAAPDESSGAGQAQSDPAFLATSVGNSPAASSTAGPVAGPAVNSAAGPAAGPADALPPPTGEPIIDTPPTADETPTAVISAVPADVPLGGAAFPGPDDAPTQLIPVQSAAPVEPSRDPGAQVAQPGLPGPAGHATRPGFPGSQGAVEYPVQPGVHEAAQPVGWVWPGTPVEPEPNAHHYQPPSGPPLNPFTPSVQPPALTQQLPAAFQAAASVPPAAHPEPAPAARHSGMGFPAPPPQPGAYVPAFGDAGPAIDHPIGPAASRPKRRRTALISSLAAIAVIGVAAAVITLNGGGGSPQHASADTDATGGPVTTSGSPSPGAAGAAGLAGATSASVSASVSASASSSSAADSASSSASSPVAVSSRSGGAIAPATSAAAPTAASLNASLALHWRLADGSGATARDSGPRGIVGAVAGPVKFGPAHGGAAVFTPASGQIKGGQITASGVLDTTRSFTVSEWVDQTTPTTPTKYVSAFSQDGPNFSAFFFTYSTAQQTWFFGRSLSATANNGTDESWGTPSPLNTWILLTGVYDATAGTVTLYVNGVAQQPVHTRTAPYAATGPFTVGRSWYQTYPSNPFAGSVSDVRVYNRVLTPAEVHSLLSAG